MHLLKRVVAPLGLLTLLAVSSISTIPAVAAHGNDVVGHVYVNDNTTGTNTIAGFDRHVDGSLTPLAGSPFAAGGQGNGQGIASQGALQLSSDGHFLLAVDALSNQISVLKVAPDGALRPVADSPVSSGGIDPVSIAVSGNLIYVANAGSGGSNYNGFTLNPGGHLHPLPNSTVSLPDGSQPGDVLFSPDGKHLAGTRVGTSQIDSFSVGPDGRLTAAPGSPYNALAFNAVEVGPFGSEFRPTDSSQLFVSNAHDGAGNGTVSSFSVASNGSLSQIGSSPFADNQTAPCWVELTHDGRYLFTVNTASSTISRFAIAADGSLSLQGSTPFTEGTGLGSEDARLDPSGGNLYVVDSKIGAVSIFAVADGNLTELTTSPALLPPGAAAAGIVVI